MVKDCCSFLCFSCFFLSTVTDCCFSFYFQGPLNMDLVIYLSQDGIRLIFDPVSQRLKVSSSLQHLVVTTSKKFLAMQEDRRVDSFHHVDFFH